MKYIHVLTYIQSSILAIHPDKRDAILAVIAHRAAGHVFSEEEIQAQIGAASGGTSSQSGAVAVVSLRGVIAHRMSGMADSSGGASAERFTKTMQQAASDPAISAIVIDVDSPGGTVNGVSEAAQAVFDARQQKPVIAHINGMGASAAYWAISGAHEIVASPGLIDNSIGSIGVFTVHQDLSAALEKEGIKPTIISAGKYKTEGNPFEPLSEERRAVLQGSVDAAYARFTADVARGRGVDVAAVRNGYGEGRALSAADAKRAGMVDRIATMDATLARLGSPQVRGKIMSGARAEEGTYDLDAEASDAAASVPVHGIQLFQETNGDADRLRRLRLR